VDSHSRRWSPARIVWRWSCILWIGPLLGLLTGLILVFGFLKVNVTTQSSFNLGFIPESVDVEPFTKDLRSEFESESTWIEVRRKLGQDQALIKTPLWWLRSRIKLLDVPKGSGNLNMLFTYHTEYGLDELKYAFEKVSIEVVPRVKEKYVEGWLAKINARLGEIEVFQRVEESEGKNVDSHEIPFAEEREDLEVDRKLLLENEEEYLGREVGLPGTFGSWPSWWKAPPKFSIFVFMCVGYGILAILPLMYMLEGLWPRDRATEGVRLVS